MIRKKIFLLTATTTSLLLAAFTYHGTKKSAVIADTVFVNGKVVTVDSSNSIASAVAIKDGKILAVGTTDEINQLKGNTTTVIDLKGKTLLPGFVDGHSHIMGLANESYANLGSPPMGPVKNIAGIVAELQKYKKDNDIKPGEWVIGYGYDQDQLEEKRHPAKEDLDAAFPDNPVSITNINGHMLVANSYALKLSGIDASTPNPDGGAIVRKTGTNEPAGLLQEGAMRLLKKNTGAKPTLDQSLARLQKAQEYYAGFGVTTAQDGYSSFESLQLLSAAAKQERLFIDIDALPGYPVLDKVLGNPDYKFGSYDHHLKLAGFKIISDGSPQGKTAFFTKAYLTPVPGCTDHCTGFPNLSQEQLNEAILKGFKNNIQPYVHCNGDAAVDHYIIAVENANKNLGGTSVGRRPVVIHSQFARADQLDKYKSLGFIPSFFTNHTFFWGDVHVQNLGKDRAFFSSPVKAALQKGIIFTNHTDFPVTPINPLFLLWTSVNRLSRSGNIIGPDQRLTPEEGIRALTINGAYEYFEENTKGSIEKGKLADLVILSEDPLTIDPAKIKDITVLETYKEGKQIFKR